MAEKRRQYTEEYTRDAIRLVTEQGYSVSETARNLGINAHLLGRWTREVDTTGSTAFPCHGRMASAQEEWPRLRMERDLLKTALGFCASGPNGGRPLWLSPSTPGR